MCGIAGAAWTGHGPPLSDSTLRRMTDVLRHRGPDDDGFYFTPGNGVGGATPGAALGFRRLSIIDLAGGHQPLSNEDDSVWIVFNGEIYNYRELRPQLESLGHRFRTASDTETIVHLYEQHGTDCLRHLRGMFAFAIWDERNKRLFLARDRLGQKPLVYRLEPDRLLFASELKALLEVPAAPREIDPESIDLFLTYQYVPHPRSILKGYAKLPPAHFAVYERGALRVERYWQPPYRDDFDRDGLADPALAGSADWTADAWRGHLRRTLTEAVRLRMRSDVPLGAFLSGGIDSTIIAGLMQSQSERPVHTFSIGFPIKKFDERHYARDAARHLKTNHHEYVVEPSVLEVLPKLVWHYDEPFGDSSAIPTMYLSEVTRREVTVALSGDGGDELFAGYERYRAVRLAAWLDRLPEPVRKVFASSLWQKIPASVEQRSLRRRVKRFAAALGQPPERRYLRWICIFDAELRAQLYTDEFKRQLRNTVGRISNPSCVSSGRLGIPSYGFDSSDFIESCYAACPGRDFITRTTCADVLSYLPCDILTKVDIASMAYSLEARSPFLDHHVAELAARMPIALKQRGPRGKLILLDTFRDLLPESIQTRGKMGFGIPIDHWFRDELRPLVHDTLLGGAVPARGWFNPAFVRRLVEEHESGQWDHSYRLWNLIVFEQWCRRFLDASGTV
jgi:asparagine synthase (glutamine-hydrolysing)